MTSLTVVSFREEFTSLALRSHVVINIEDYLAIFESSMLPSIVNVKSFVYRVVSDSGVEKGTIMLNQCQRLDTKSQLGGKVTIVPIKPNLLHEHMQLEGMTLEISYLSSEDLETPFIRNKLIKSMEEYFRNRFVKSMQLFVVKVNDTRLLVKVLKFVGNAKGNVHLCTSNTVIDVVSDSVKISSEKYVVFDFKLKGADRQQLTKKETIIAKKNIDNIMMREDLSPFLSYVDSENLRLFLKYTTFSDSEIEINDIDISDELCLRKVSYEKIDADDFDVAIIAEREYYED